jgi:hypothetical protein
MGDARDVDRYNIIDEQDLARAVAKRFSNAKNRQSRRLLTHPMIR